MGSDVADSLEKYVKDNAIDALALTTHKRGMLTRLFNPSLARQMAIDTHLPLLVFHA
jgi:nucleotide-binding universal stress UspA family protein